MRYERNARNLGAPANYRRAFELSRGRYFRWAAADDVSAPQSLARCLEVLEREPNVVLAYPKTRFIDERSRVTADYEDRLHVQSSKASDRFCQVLRRLERCNAIYGLMRADVLKCTRLLGDFLAADVVFMTELSLYGTFWEVPEFLFYRRFHAAASSAMDQTQIRTFYDPANPRRLPLPTAIESRSCGAAARNSSGQAAVGSGRGVGAEGVEEDLDFLDEIVHRAE